jgi:5-methylcytosine-specific restriction endonuclease McrA
MAVEGSVIVSPYEREDGPQLVRGLPAEEVHRRALAARRLLGKAQTALGFWLTEVEKRELYRHFGCSSVFHYAEIMLGLAPHTIAEHLRTAKELERLPKLAEAVARGEVAPSKVREISRVATSETEDYWVQVGASSTYRQVEKLVAMTPKGGLPAWAPKPAVVASSAVVEGKNVGEERGTLDSVGDVTVPAVSSPQPERSAADGPRESVGPMRYRSKFIVDLEGDQMAILDKALEKAREESGRRERGELLLHIARAFLDAGGSNDSNGAPYRITLHHDESANLTWVEGGAGPQFVPASTFEEAICDAEIVDLKQDVAEDSRTEVSEERGDSCCTDGCSHEQKRPARDAGRRGPRLRRTIPPTLRRKVLERDGCCCTVPGCRCRRHIHIHHIDPLAEGGADKAGNLVTLCSRHHRMVHRGELSVKGRAPDGLIWCDAKGKRLNVSF